MAALSWGLRFFIYYGIVLCVAPIFSLITPLLCTGIQQVLEQPESSYYLISPTVFMYITGGLFCLQYFWFFMVFLLNYAAESAFPEGYVECTRGKDILLLFWHWLLTLPTVVAYCIIELLSFFEVAIRGKDVCEHKPSKKDNLRIQKY